MTDYEGTLENEGTGTRESSFEVGDVDRILNYFNNGKDERDLEGRVAGEDSVNEVRESKVLRSISDHGNYQNFRKRRVYRHN